MNKHLEEVMKLNNSDLEHAISDEIYGRQPNDIWFVSVRDMNGAWGVVKRLPEKATQASSQAGVKGGNAVLNYIGGDEAALELPDGEDPFAYFAKHVFNDV